jgi:hypothetical protein
VRVTITSEAVVVGQPGQVTVDCAVATAASRELVMLMLDGDEKDNDSDSGRIWKQLG